MIGAVAGAVLWSRTERAHALFGFGDKAAPAQKPEDVKWGDVRKDIAELLESNQDYDDGSYGPLLIRLAWHASGTFSQFDKVVTSP